MTCAASGRMCKVLPSNITDAYVFFLDQLRLRDRLIEQLTGETPSPTIAAQSDHLGTTFSGLRVIDQISRSTQSGECFEDEISPLVASLQLEATTAITGVFDVVLSVSPQRTEVVGTEFSQWIPTNEIRRCGVLCEDIGALEIVHQRADAPVIWCTILQCKEVATVQSVVRHLQQTIREISGEHIGDKQEMVPPAKPSPICTPLKRRVSKRVSKNAGDIQTATNGSTASPTESYSPNANLSSSPLVPVYTADPTRRPKTSVSVHGSSVCTDKNLSSVSVDIRGQWSPNATAPAPNTTAKKLRAQTETICGCIVDVQFLGCAPPPPSMQKSTTMAQVPAHVDTVVSKLLKRSSKTVVEPCFISVVNGILTVPGSTNAVQGRFPNGAHICVSVACRLHRSVLINISCGVDLIPPAASSVLWSTVTEVFRGMRVPAHVAMCCFVRRIE
eukprot:m.153304 g.153304  ORF g.153304 m.153304 type:complete len:445 (+) comp17911_c0_seq1:429-1763(+)